MSQRDKLDGKNLPAVTTADSDQLEVRDVVLAIGNPFGIGHTVTMGIVSATGRGGFGVVDYEDFIQTNASINPGDSGGALVDAEGRLVDLNTFIVSRSGGNLELGASLELGVWNLELVAWALSLSKIEMRTRPPRRPLAD